MKRRFLFIISVIGLLAAAPAVWASPDTDIADHYRNHPRMETVDNIAAVVGSPYLQSAAAFATYGIAYVSKNLEWQKTGEAWTEALVLAESSALLLKVSVRRERPNGSNYSFPSGHTAASFATASVLETLEGPAFGVPAFLAAGLIGFTRIDHNDHYLSDVIGGAALGLAWGWGVAHFHKTHAAWHLFPWSGGGTGVEVARDF